MRNNLIIGLGLLLFLACNKNNTEEGQISLVEMLPSPADSVSAEPYLFTGPEGTIYLSWIQQKGDSSYLQFTTLNNGKWSEVREIAKGSDWFVNWADFPSLSINTQGHIMAHFLSKSGAGTYAYDIQLTRSEDQGASWSAPMVLHDDGREAEHGFVTMLPYQDLTLITWLDGRNTVSDTPEESHTNHESGHDGHGAMTIRAALLDKQGNKTNEWELDARVCDCCQTTAAITGNGPIIIYRDRSENEIRDISIVRWIDSTWTAPQVIYNDEWKIAGCPVNGPRADAIDNNLAMAWFSAPEGNPQVKVIFSTDGGKTFGEPVRVDSAKAVGRVDLVMLDKDTAVVSWMENADIKAVKVTKEGITTSPVVIGSSSEARASGFPQMTKNDRQLIFAWTDNQEKKIKTATWWY